jgi:hypothetical protein
VSGLTFHLTLQDMVIANKNISTSRSCISTNTYILLVIYTLYNHVDALFTL